MGLTDEYFDPLRSSRIIKTGKNFLVQKVSSLGRQGDSEEETPPREGEAGKGGDKERTAKG